jgi:glutamine amidotransferase
MCELLAMSSREPATVSLSLSEFANHGGRTGPHKDGWGVAFYDENDVRLVREANAASESRAVAFLADQAYRSTRVLAHIRQATFGPVKLKNSQPFTRELGGRMHVFAHNGDLPEVEVLRKEAGHCFRPVGDSDSEHAFCLLLERLRPLWGGDQPPSMEQRMAAVEGFAREVSPLGPSNFIFSDSDFLYIYAHKRTQPEDNQIRAPGLYYLCRTCPSRKPAERSLGGISIASHEGPQQEVFLAASVPLTDERWVALAEGELLVVERGRIRERRVVAAAAGTEAGREYLPVGF